MKILFALSALLALFSQSSAQVGTTLCQCSPFVYEFTFDFELTCGGSTVPDGNDMPDVDGVEETT